MPEAGRTYYPVLAGAWEPNAPPGTLTPQSSGLYRDTLNVLVRFGLLRRRPSLLTPVTIAQPAPSWISSYNPGEIPLWIYTAFSPSIVQQVCIVVTSRQAYVTKDGGASWTNITPTYTFGTVTATNGSKSVAGAGTAWTTRGITPGQGMLIDGAWYEIDVVTSNVAITLKTNFTGATGAGKAYSIRRTWKGGALLKDAPLVFCRLFNQTLYIASSHLAAGDGTVSPAIIRVADILGTPVPSYITGSKDLTGTLDYIAAATTGYEDLKSISGIDVLQTGAVVFTANENTFYYSSPVSDAVWTSSPAGFEPVYLKPGAITAMGNLGTDLTIHFEDGIVLAVPVERAEPPVVFQLTNAVIGAYAPRTLLSLGGLERFVGIDGRPYGFDGAKAVPLGDAPIKEFASANLVDLRYQLHASFDSHYNEYWIFREQGTGETVGLSLNIDSGWWFSHQYNVPIGCVSVRNDLASSYTSSQTIAGISNFDVAEGSPRSTLLLYSQEDVYLDTNVAFTGSDIGSHFFILEDLDFGAPESYKSIQSIVLWSLNLGGGTTDVTFSLSRDRGATYERTASKTITNSAGETLTRFNFDALSAPLWTVKYEVSGASLKHAPTRLLIIWELGAGVWDVEP